MHYKLTQVSLVHMFLCYEKASDEDSGWIVAGWAKTSMEIALSKKPMLTGRLRTAEDGGLEIVLNDSGIKSLLMIKPDLTKTQTQTQTNLHNKPDLTKTQTQTQTNLHKIS